MQGKHFTDSHRTSQRSSDEQKPSTSIPRSVAKRSPVSKSFSAKDKFSQVGKKISGSGAKLNQIAKKAALASKTAAEKMSFQKKSTSDQSNIDSLKSAQRPSRPHKRKKAAVLNQALLDSANDFELVASKAVHSVEAQELPDQQKVHSEQEVASEQLLVSEQPRRRFSDEAAKKKNYAEHLHHAVQGISHGVYATKTWVKAHPRTMIALGAVVLLMLVFYDPVKQLYHAWRDNEIAHVQLSELESDNNDIKNDISNLQTRDGIIDEARKKGYVDPGEVSVIVDNKPSDLDAPEPRKPAEKPWTIKALDTLFFYVEPQERNQAIQK